MVTYLKSWFGRFEAVTYRRPDPWLWLPAAALLLLGLLMVLNTTYFLGLEKTGDAFHFFKLHLAHIAVGFVLLMLLSQFSLAGLRRIVLPLFVISLVMLVLLYVPGLGLVRGGARRWLRLGPVIAEPSELVKFALVFFLAEFLSGRQERIREFNHGPLSVFLIVGPITLFILKQPDFGSTVMIALVLFAMLYAAGARWKHLAARGRRRARLARVPGGGEIVSDEAAHYFSRSVVDRARRGIPAGAIVYRARRGRRVGRRSRRGSAENVLSAGGAHRFRFRGGGRGVRPDRRGGRGCAVRRDSIPRDANRARRARSVCESARGRADRAALVPGVDQHGGGDRTDPDQGTAVAVPQLRRHFDHHRDGGVGRVARARAPAGGAMKVIIAGGGTGGHLFPAVALGEEMIRERPALDVLFVGTDQRH